MFRIKQHIPNFASGIEPDVLDFSTKDELLKIWFVESYSKDPDFSSFALSDYVEGVVLLMAIYDKGKRWRVIGYITGENIYSLDFKKWKEENNV
jgi:hypothetical protein